MSLVIDYNRTLHNSPLITFLFGFSIAIPPPPIRFKCQFGDHFSRADSMRVEHCIVLTTRFQIQIFGIHLLAILIN